MCSKPVRILFFLVIFLNLAWISYLTFRYFHSSTSPLQTTNNKLLTGFSCLLSPTTCNPQPIAIIAVGDIMLGRKVNVQMVERNDWLYPFSETATITSTADLAIGNLESQFLENCPTQITTMSFCARPESLAGIKLAGFDVLNLANNHVHNKGDIAIDLTEQMLTDADITYTGSPLHPGLTTRKVGDTAFGFLGFDLTVDNKPDPVLAEVKKYANSVDYLIVSLHWGVEYEKEPRAWQKTLAHQIIDAGASMIIGHHPHVTQPVENYNGKLIFYSLGNFVFDQMWSDETRQGLIAKITLQPDGTQTYELTPTLIYDFAQPRINN